MTRRTFLNLLSGLDEGFSDGFARSDGALGNGWTGAQWTIASGAALCTPGLSAEKFTNGTFEGAFNTTGTLVIGTGWTNLNMDDGADVASDETTTFHGGAHSQGISVSAIAEGIQQALLVFGIGNWCKYDAWFYVVSGSGGRLITSSVGPGGATFSKDITTTGSWVNVKHDGRSAAASPNTQIYGLGTTVFYVDDVSGKQITINNCVATRAGTKALGRAAVKVTIANPGCMAGVAMCVDSAATPNNMVVCYIDGNGTSNKIYMDKRVGGTWTTVASATIAYAAGRKVELRHTAANTWQMWYNEIQIGTDQTISDAGIVGNTLHGMFSTDATNSLDDFTLV